MKLFKLTLIVLACAFVHTTATAQNAMVNIMTRDAGIVKKGKNVFLEVTINNTNPTNYIGIYKLKVQVNVPSSIATIEEKGHELPTNWSVASNDGTTIYLSNGKDMIAANDRRTLLIALKGVKAGGPSTISAQLTFSNGEAPGTAPGVLAGDNPADNSSTTTIRVK